MFQLVFVLLAMLAPVIWHLLTPLTAKSTELPAEFIVNVKRYQVLATTVTVVSHVPFEAPLLQTPCHLPLLTPRLYLNRQPVVLSLFVPLYIPVRTVKVFVPSDRV